MRTGISSNRKSKMSGASNYSSASKKQNYALNDAESGVSSKVSKFL
jgi:hypothetical protein